LGSGAAVGYRKLGDGKPGGWPNGPPLISAPGPEPPSGAMRPWASWPRPGNLDTTEVTLVVDRGVINALVARKYLRPTDRSTKDAMRYAIQDCLERALGLSDKVGSF
jgi:hypothetical protein